jgi:hypothetical protein
MSPSATHEPPRIRPDRSVLVGSVALALASLGGAWLSVAGDLSDTAWQAMGPKGRLSIPVPMMLAQLVAAMVAAGRRPRPAVIAAALLAVVEPICIVSGLFDGGYTDPDRSALQIAYQVFFVGMIALVGVLAVRRFVTLRRSPASV